MMDLMEGSHSMRTPGVQCVSRCLFCKESYKITGQGVLGWFLGDKGSRYLLLRVACRAL